MSKINPKPVRYKDVYTNLAKFLYMIEYKKEKWFEFRRIHCKEGYIDYFLGDQADDPNKQNKSRISLNSSGEWFRFKGENTWLNKRDFERNAVITIVNNKEEFSSDELKTILEIN